VSFSGSMSFMPYFSTYGVTFRPLLLGHYASRVSDLGLAEYLGGQGMY
jgi:hypothetical protein